MGFLTTPDGTNPKYTGQQRDQETATDWFQVRQMSGAQGRFQSPDPGNAGADPSNPQSWNGYAYVGNNPLSYTDPSGMFTEPSDGDPISAIIGGLIDLGELLGDIFGGGGPPPSIPSALATPSSPILQPSPDFDSQGGNGQTPDDGSIDTGTVFGSGDAGPFSNNVIRFDPNNPITLTGTDVVATALGLIVNWGWRMSHLPPHGMRVATGPIPVNPTPRRFFGTYYCGTGGAGPRSGVVNGACAAHDDCYAAAGINGTGNTNPAIIWSSAQVAAASSPGLNRPFSSRRKTSDSGS
jgi:RHS repeat-associated protein